MPAITASAPGKIILIGEHAVVYGRPAIAVPVQQVQAKALVIPEPAFPRGGIFIRSAETGLEAWLADLPEEHPLGLAVRLAMDELGYAAMPAFTLQVTSTIPRAAGLGSGAAVSIAIIRAVAGFAGRPLSDARLNALAYEVEKIHHGTPSGIDNTVIAYGMPVYFVRDAALETFSVAQPFTVVIGDSGVRSPTAAVVGDVRSAWQAQPERYEVIFDAIGQIAAAARNLIQAGGQTELGRLMDENHGWLQEMGVSSPELDRLVAVARSAGALGAKLSGGGRGGNMIALVRPEQAAELAQKLLSNGAVRTIVTEIK